MSASETLSVKSRKKLGSRATRALRYGGGIPATIQVDGDHLDIALDRREFLAARRHHVHLFDLDVEGNVESAVIRELQWDTFGEEIIHVEFKRVQRGVETETEVELAFTGHPKGGVCNHIVSHVAINCIPSLIPDEIEVKVGHMEEGDSIHAKDLILPPGLSLAVDPELLIATVAEARAEIEPSSDEDDLDAGLGIVPETPAGDE